MKERLKTPQFDVICLTEDIHGIEILAEYTIGHAKVYITKDGRYVVIEPELTKDGHEIYQYMMQQMFLSLEPLRRTENPVEYIEKHIWKEAEAQAIVNKIKTCYEQLRYYLVRDILGYGILDVIMNDDNIEEITAERFDRKIGVIHRKFTEFNILDSNISFGSDGAMNSYIQKIMQRTGNNVTAASPIMNAMTPEGDRIMVTYENEISLPGPTLDIRKFTREPYTITHLLEFGALDKWMAAYLWMLLDAKAFGLIVGETGSGKTTAINALMSMTNPRWKIVTIEETPELKIPHYRWQRMFTRTSPMITQSNFDITIMDLIKASLRMRPDFEIVGEVRGEEAKFLFQSAATGHGGLSTIHGSDAESALSRLSAEPINIKASQQMLLWFILHITRVTTKDKKISRKVVSIKEVVPNNDEIKLEEIFHYDFAKNNFGVASIDELITKSSKLHQAAEFLNVDLYEDIQKRVTLIDACIKSKARKTHKVFSILSDYYKSN